MTDYISREAALRDIYELIAVRNSWLSDARGEIQGLNAAVCVIEDIPAATDVRPVVRGKWKLATYSGKFGTAKAKWYDQFLDGAFWYCDCCKERAAKRTNYCQNCGADMRTVIPKDSVDRPLSNVALLRSLPLESLAEWLANELSDSTPVDWLAWLTEVNRL